MTETLEFRQDDDLFQRARNILKRAGFADVERLGLVGSIAEGMSIYEKLDAHGKTENSPDDATETKMLNAGEIRKAIAHYLSRQGSAEYDNAEVVLAILDSITKNKVTWQETYEVVAIANPRRTGSTE